MVIEEAALYLYYKNLFFADNHGKWPCKTATVVTLLLAFVLIRTVAAF